MNDDAARRWYRRLLRIAPARLRDRHAGEMEEAFLQPLSALRARFTPAAVVGLARQLGDMLFGVPPHDPFIHATALSIY